MKGYERRMRNAGALNMAGPRVEGMGSRKHSTPTDEHGHSLSSQAPTRPEYEEQSMTGLQDSAAFDLSASMQEDIDEMWETMLEEFTSMPLP
jgi:hypothetical protein